MFLHRFRPANHFGCIQIHDDRQLAMADQGLDLATVPITHFHRRI